MGCAIHGQEARGDAPSNHRAVKSPAEWLYNPRASIWRAPGLVIPAEPGESRGRAGIQDLDCGYAP